MKLSVVIIAKNAEKQISDAILSASFADEVIVVDGGSRDKTVEKAEKMGAKVFLHETSDFSDMRNFGLEKAKGEWILYLDTDERITEELVSNISKACLLPSKNVKYQFSSKEIPSFAAFKIKRKNFYLGKHEWPYIEKLERLFRKNALRGWYGKLHESPNVEGAIGELDGFLLHYTHQDLNLMLTKTIVWSKIEAQLRFQAGHPKMSWWRFFRIVITAFYDSYVLQGGWKVGVAGLIESLYQAFSMFITYARLWEMQQKLKVKS